MGIPEKVKIGGLTYKVKMVKNIDRSRDNLGGLQYEITQKIHLRKGMAKEITEKIFIHELIHAIFCHCDIEQDEHKVELISNALYMVIKDNPGIFSFSEE